MIEGEAEACWRGLAAGEDVAARALLTRLIRVAAGAAPQDLLTTTRRVPAADLPPDERSVASRFTRARLVTESVDPAGNATVELAHEALLTSWPRLGRLAAALAPFLGWRAARFEPWLSDGELLRGSKLADAHRWASDFPAGFTEPERVFIGRSSRAASRRRWTVAGVQALVVVLAAAAIVFAVGARQQASHARASRSDAQAQARSSDSRRLAVQAQSIAGEDPDRAVLLSLAAYRLTPTFEARNALLTVLPRLDGADGRLQAASLTRVGAFAVPGGKLVVTDEDDGVMRVWDLATRRQTGAPMDSSASGSLRAVPTLPERTNRGRIVDATPDGAFLAVEAYRRGDETELWNLRTRRLQEHVDGQAIGFSDNGRTLLTATVIADPDGFGGTLSTATASVHEFDVASGRRVRSSSRFHISSGALASIGPRAAGVSTVRIVSVDVDDPDDSFPGQVAEVRDVRSGRRVGSFTVRDGEIVMTRLSPDQGVVAVVVERSGGWLRIKFWDVASRRWTSEIRTGDDDEFGDAVFSPSGRRIAIIGESNVVHVWDVTSGAPVIQPLQGHTDQVTGVAFGADDRSLLTKSRDSSVRVWDLERQLRQPLAADVDEPVVAFSPDDRQLVSADSSSVRIWSTSTRRVARGPVPVKDASMVAWSRDGRTLATGRYVSRKVQLWDAATLQGKRELKLPHEVWGLQFARGDVLVADGSRVELWDTEAGRAAFPSLPGHGFGFGFGLSVSADGGTLATPYDALYAGDDATIKVWRIGSAHPLASIVGGFSSIALSPDGRTISGGGDGFGFPGRRLWSATTGRQLGGTFAKSMGAVWSSAFSPDGKVLATAGEDDTVRLWDVATQRQLGPSVHVTGATHVAFSHDGRLLAVAGSHEVQLWDSIAWSDDAQALGDRVCESVGRDLTRAEWSEYMPRSPYQRTCG